MIEKTESAKKLDEAYEGIIEAFDRIDASTDRMMYSLTLLQGIIIGITVSMIATSIMAYLA